jgi:hypothetical protein
MADKDEARTLAGSAHVLPADASVDSEIERLRAELAEERERRIVAEAVAEERAQALEDARLALRAVAAAEAANGAANGEGAARDVAQEDDPRPRPRGNWLR